MGDPQFPRAWSSERRPTVPPEFAEELEMALGVGDKGIYLRCESAGDIDLLVKGAAKFLPPPVRCFRLSSDEVSAEEAGRMMAPLLAGESIVVAYEGPSDLAGALHDQWLECTQYPDGTTFVYGNFVMRGVEKPGFFATVHVLGGGGSIGYRQPILRVPAEEVATLEMLGQMSLHHVIPLGRAR